MNQNVIPEKNVNVPKNAAIANMQNSNEKWILKVDIYKMDKITIKIKPCS
jgi:hypothetical protein